MKLVFIALTILVSGAAFAGSGNLRSANYECKSDSDAKAIGANKDFTAKFSKDADSGVSRIKLTRSDKKFLSGTMEAHDIAFVNLKGNLLPARKLGYIMMDTDSANATEIVVAIQLDESTYENERLQCHATGKVDEVAYESRRIKCTTDKKQSGRHIVLSFNLLTNDSKSETTVGSDNEDDYEPIKVTPKDSDATSINENLVVTDGKKGIRFYGDADGFYSVVLMLYHDSDLRAGYLRIDGGDNDFYSTVTCE